MLLIVPGPHAAHEPEPGRLYMPAAHGAHCVAAAALANVPATQGMHALEPVLLVDVPGIHGTQRVALLLLYVPLPHLSHWSALSPLIVPAAHGTQTPQVSD